MGPALGLIGLLGGLVALIWLVVALIRRKPKRILGLVLSGFFVLFVLGLVLTPTPEPTSTTTPNSTPTPTATPRPTSAPSIQFIGAADLSDESKSSLAELIERIQEGVVQIATDSGSGSGFIVDPNGLVVTNEHVVEGARRVEIWLTNGRRYDGDVLERDVIADLALVQIDSEHQFRVIPIGNPDGVRVGDEVLALGFPLADKIGSSLTVTRGIISSTRTLGGVELLQTDAAINPGNSGGPLVNRDGEIIGINTSRVEETDSGRPVSGIGFAVSVIELERRLPMLNSRQANPSQTTPTPTALPTPTPAAQVVDTVPVFSSGVSDLDYTVGTAISSLTFPAATGGNGSLIYSLTPSVSGLRFSPQTRQLTGTPTSPGTYNMTYRVADADDNDAATDTDAISFTITVVVPDTPPRFSENVSNLEFTAGEATSSTTLPAATGGNGELTYYLTPAVPGLTFSQATRQLTGTPTAIGTYNMTYRVTDADDNIAEIDADTVWFTITVAMPLIDYDADDDGLIEISNLEQLDAIRHDTNGDGMANHSSTALYYTVAFPNPVPGMGCTFGCAGYELARDLDFANDDSYASGVVNPAWRLGTGWERIGNEHDRFATTFDGNGHTISNLYIDRSDTSLGGSAVNPSSGAYNIGLFGYTGTSGVIRGVGLVSVDVSGWSAVGALVGRNTGTISSSFIVGVVTGDYNAVGGLVGHNEGSIVSSYSQADVSALQSIGGLVGTNEGVISASYASGSVSGHFVRAGGLVGQMSGGSIRTSYATTIVSEPAVVAGEGIYQTKGSARKGVNLYYYIHQGQAILVMPRSSYEAGDDPIYGVQQLHGGMPPDHLTANFSVGGLVGAAGNVSIIGSYWDTDTSGMTAGVGSGNAPGAIGKTTTELQIPTGYTGIYSFWNIDVDGDGDPDDIWDFGTSSDYPRLHPE